MSIYDQPPLSFIQQALLSQLGGAPSGGYVPISAELRQPAPRQHSYYGPTHQALSEAFSNALQKQAAVPGLLSQLMADPRMASKVGGFTMQSYTPNVPQTGINWGPPAADAAAISPAMPAAGGFLNSQTVDPGIRAGQNTLDGA